MDLDYKDDQASPGLVAKNFRKISRNGLGDPYNAYPHSMAWFGDYLCVGTTRANLANRAFQINRKTPERLGEIWPVRIPVSWRDNDLRAQIWRYQPSTGEWSKVFTSPMVRGIDGFDVPLSIGFRCMISFQGLSDSAPALYVPTWGTYQTPTTFMLRSGDGINFEVVSEPGLCIPDHKPWGLRGLVSFKGLLFASPAVGKGRHEANTAAVMAIFVSSDPARGDWRLACEPHFGDSNNVSVFQMATFNGYLYAGTLNINEGFQVWKTDANGEPPFKWKKVLSHGAYRGKLNQIAMTLVPFEDYLYVGSGIQHGGFDFDNNLGPAAPELIRINPDGSWDLIFGEPRITPDGLKVPLSGLGPGLGNPFSGYIWSMCAHEGWLYAGTAVWTAFLRYSARDRWPEVLRIVFTPKNVERLLHEFGGCDLWRSRDGYHWIPVTLNGFDNCFNIGFRNMVSSPYGLFVGAANSFAPEVAVKRVAGWNYEDNPKGGLEIWLGSHKDTVQSESLGSLGETSVCGARVQVIKKKTSEKDEESPEKIISEFYEGSDFRHFGFWRVGINDAKAACENLMDELLAFIPEKRGNIIDIGCGLGATTQYLLKHFPAEAVTGITTDKKALEVCQKKGFGVKFLYRKLPDLKLPDESFNFVIWVKGHGKLCSRRKLLREGFRILRPGGRLVCFDVVYATTTRGNLWEKIRLRERPVEALHSYRDLLLAQGFQEVQMADVTADCYGGFRKQLAKYFWLRRLAGKIGHVTFQDLETYLVKDELAVHQCLLISGCKPEKRKESGA